jgi:protein-disulfide isomerase
MVTKNILTLALLSSVLSAAAFAGSSDGPTSGPAPSEGPVVIEIDGVRLTITDLEKRRPGALFQAKNAFFQAERKAMEDMVDDYLLERQAQREHVSIPELLEKHVNHTIAPDPNDDALKLLHEALDAKEPFETLKPQILDHLRQTRISKAKENYVKTLRAESSVVVSFAPPRTQVSLKDTPVLGPSSAPVTIVEYADYECPYCQQAQPILDRLQAEYKGKIALAFKDYPLPMHGHAQKASEAANCAGLQGKYWEYHDLLFKNKQLEIADLKVGARSLNLDGKAFDQCLDSGQEADAVKAHQTEGKDLEIRGTPSYVINGRFLAGGTYEQLKQAIDEELGAKASQTKVASK